MADEREKISTGPNEEAINETIAGTGPGISDDALAPDEEELPEAPSDNRSKRQPKPSARRAGSVTRCPLKVNESPRK